VETRVFCSDCGKPICPDCMVQAAVGIKCRDCARLPRSARVTLRPARAGRAVVVSLGSGAGLGVVLGLVTAQTLLFGLLGTLVAGVLVGMGVGRSTLWASGYFRSSATGWIASAGAVVAYIVAAAVVAATFGGSIRFYLVAETLGLLVAAFFAHREAS
jgi:hypothetical protein